MSISADALTHSPHRTKGILFAIAGFFFMAVFGVLTKVACEAGNFIWVSIITYGVASLGTGALILPGGMQALKSEHYFNLFARAIIGTIASFLYMMSMHYISVVNSTLLFNTAPIFIPVIMACFLHIRSSHQIWAAVLMGFIGILVIIKPNASLFTDPGNLIGLVSGIALAVAYLYMKILTSTDTRLRIIFYYFTIGFLMQLPLLWFAGEIPASNTIFYAGLCGVALMMAQLALVNAYNYATASEVGVYQYSSVVFVSIIEWIIWSLTPDLLSFIGFALVSVAGIYIICSSS